MQVGVSDISLNGRVRTTLIPLLFDMPVVGAVQVMADSLPIAYNYDIRRSIAYSLL